MERVERPDDAYLDEIEHIRHERRREWEKWQDKLSDDDYAELMENRRELHEYTKSI